MCSICPVSCTIVIIGVIIFFLYHYNSRIEDSKACKEEDLRVPKYKDNEDLFILQYEQISEGIRSRDSVTIVAGTILITASLLLLNLGAQIQSFSIKLTIVLASLAIYTIWLIGHELTTKKVHNVDYSRLKEMEKNEDYKINIHTYRLKKVEGKIWWKPLRRKIWLWLLWVLIIVSIAILAIPTPA